MSSFREQNHGNGYRINQNVLNVIEWNDETKTQYIANFLSFENDYFPKAIAERVRVLKVDIELCISWHNFNISDGARIRSW